MRGFLHFMIKFLQRFQLEQIKIVSEKAYFKNNFKRYYVKRNSRGEIYFWAHQTIPKDTQLTFDDKESYYLGQYTREKGWIKPENYYQLAWDVQRSGSRLFTDFIKDQDNSL